MRRVALKAFCLAGLLPALQVVAAATPPPISAYATLPAMAAPRLSPDGSRLLYLRAIGETYHAAVIDLDEQKSSLVMAADPDQFLINWCRWANEARIVCSIRYYGTLRAGQVGAGRRWYRDGRTTFTRMIAMDADGSNQLQLIEEPANRLNDDLEWNAVDQDNVISWLPDDPDHVLVQLNREERTRPSVYRLNVNSNALTLERHHVQSVLRWYADREGRLRFATGYRGTEPGAFIVDERNRLTELDLTPVESDLTPDVVGLSRDGEHVYFASYHDGGFRRLYQVDARTGAEITALFTIEGFDFFGDLIEHPMTGRPLFAQYYTETLSRYWFDRDLEAALAGALAALAAVHRDVAVIDMDRKLQRFILLGEGGGSPPTYYLYEKGGQGVARLASTYPALSSVIDPELVGYPARDGYPITAYLTRPSGPGPFPTVVLPHGGPNARDHAGFNYWSQFLVSRGYAVLQPNFRGSVGYGAEHLRLGFEQWGLRMQDDVIDGLDWMIEEKITDPDRVCFVGGSYGGYVALTAAFKTPGRLKCAVSFAGVTDLAHLKEHALNYDLGVLRIARIQSGKAVPENSPARQVARIGVPLLIVHGDLDRSVMIDQSRQLVALLEKAGKDVRYIELTGGDHFLSRQQHRTEFFEALDGFLGRHLRQAAGSSE